jgi:hypothetical protein
MPSFRKALACAGLALAALGGCRSEAPDAPLEPPEVPPQTANAQRSPIASADLAPRPSAPVSSAALEVERRLRAQKLPLEPPLARSLRLAFGRGVLARLTRDALEVFSDGDLSLVGSYPLEQPRALVALADGTLLALGGKQALRFDPAAKKSALMPRPLLLPGTELWPDAADPARFWLLDPALGARERQPLLQGFRLDAEAAHGVLMPEVEQVLAAEGGGGFGRTREGVWTYFAGRKALRFSPGGLRLSDLALPALPPIMRVLPARRVDQAILLDGEGRLRRVLSTPHYRELDSVKLVGAPFEAEAGDQGRVLAVVSTLPDESGKRFQLELFDAELRPLAAVPLPADPVSAEEDWVNRLTENQQLALDPWAPRAAVGGPARLNVFDSAGRRVRSLGSP